MQDSCSTCKCAACAAADRSCSSASPISLISFRMISRLHPPARTSSCPQHPLGQRRHQGTARSRETRARRARRAMATSAARRK
eukprot:scaffold98700_cov25-Tisochrysis_lutea.AAC.6